MYWKVTYRDKSGKTVEETLEAESRDKLFAGLSERGIRATRVVQTKDKPRAAVHVPKKALVHVAAGVIVAVATLCLLFVFRGSSIENGGGEGKDNDKKSQKAEVKPVASAKTNAVNAAGAKGGEVAVNASTNAAPKSEYKDGRVLTSTTTNGMYIVEMYRMPDGKKLKKLRYAVESIWKSSTDQLLHMAFSSQPGIAAPPLPYGGGNLTKEFEESLKTPIVINKDDNEEVREAKERMIEARKQVKRLLDEGYTFEDILADHEKHNAEDVKMRNEVRERIEEFKREGDIDMAREYMTKANEVLKSAGIVEVHDRKLESADDKKTLKKKTKKTKKEN